MCKSILSVVLKYVWCMVSSCVSSVWCVCVSGVCVVSALWSVCEKCMHCVVCGV